ncbi:MAG: four helix bundle protein [Deltaproteobacteria bacterium]|nr:four helix bundle protein [Deltaproteobacteria bacterium]
MLKNYTCHGVADKRSRKELKVWQRSYKLCLEIYKMTKRFPNEERYGLTSQIRRTAVSVPSNIAEVERMLEALIKSLEKNTRTLESSGSFFIMRHIFLWDNQDLSGNRR